MLAAFMSGSQDDPSDKLSNGATGIELGGRSERQLATALQDTSSKPADPDCLRKTDCALEVRLAVRADH